MTPSEKILRYFEYDYLPPHLKRVSRPFKKLAYYLCDGKMIDNSERDMALRKLLEAKDCAVRSFL